MNATNHSQQSMDNLIAAGMRYMPDGDALKGAVRARFGCRVNDLTDAQIDELIADMPRLAHTSELHALTGLGVKGPGGTYKPDAEPVDPGQSDACDQCGRPGMWIAGAGRVLCARHQDNY